VCLFIKNEVMDCQLRVMVWCYEYFQGRVEEFRCVQELIVVLNGVKRERKRIGKPQFTVTNDGL